jgi:Glycosyltransferase family 87
MYAASAGVYCWFTATYPGLWTHTDEFVYRAAGLLARQHPADLYSVHLGESGTLQLPFTYPPSATMYFGQVNLIVLALCMGDLALKDSSRWKGIGIGIAAGIKLTPLIFIPYLLASRRVRAGVVSLLTFAGRIAIGFAVPGDNPRREQNQRGPGDLPGDPRRLRGGWRPGDRRGGRISAGQPAQG